MRGRGERPARAPIEAAWASLWFVAALLARAPFVARIEGVLDHDQSVVGLMALDISEGRRFPIFFDGQRYMGAVEAYIAAVFVRGLGHAPTVVALAPWVVFGLFVAGQFWVWSRWKDGATGHLAAFFTVACSPMLLLWGLVPRGGYIELLAWAMPTLFLYRRVAARRSIPLSKVGQVGWGFLLALGYFLNPLSLIVYVTLALDWTFVRHGFDLRRERFCRLPAMASRWLPYGLGITGLIWLLALAFCCHVDPRESQGLPYIALGGLLETPLGVACGVVGVGVLLGLAGWWSGSARRLYLHLSEHPWVVPGILAALAPFIVQGMLVKLGKIPASPSLPMWITAPWKSGRNLGTMIQAAGPLLGCRSGGVETVLIGQGIAPPLSGHAGLGDVLNAVSPWIAILVVSLLARAAWRERAAWERLVFLRGAQVGGPVVLSATLLVATFALFLLQGTSPNASSVRYLIPAWIAIPGLVACGLKSLPIGVARTAAILLASAWIGAQGLIWVDLDREMPTRVLAEELVRRRVDVVIGPTPVALVLANLTHGRVGALEYQSIWPRLGDRYRSRVVEGRPMTCVVDRRFPWAIRGEGGWAPEQDFRRHLLGLARRHPGRVAKVWQRDYWEIWEVELPLGEIAAIEPDLDEEPARENSGTGFAAVDWTP